MTNPSVIIGKTSKRSSAGSSGPPGEKEVLQHNPQRVKMILEHTGWSELYFGSLNVECDESTLQRLLDTRSEDLHEKASSVWYPGKYSHVLKKRKGYRYFDVAVRANGVTIHALLRRAVVPLQGRIELFAESMLRTALHIEIESDLEIALCDRHA